MADAVSTSVGTATVLTTVKVSVALFIALQATLISHFATLQQSADLFSQNSPNLKEKDTYDYIIVGGGTAGCLLANRLSENPDNKVLLLEKGGDPNPFTVIPLLSGSNQVNGAATLIDTYPTTAQTQVCGSALGICPLMAGHDLGGTSNVNALAITRGSPQIFDTWASLTGDDRWRYENVLPVFKKLEDYHGYYEPIDLKYHGLGGELYVSNPDRADPNQEQLDVFLQSAAASGFPLIDINNGDEARTGGSLHFDFNIKSGQRWSSYDAFLQPILTRPNLEVIRYALVTKVQLNHRRRATGVIFTKNGQTFEAHARKEVILSAGVFGTPKLLLLSGIGPAADLEAVGIFPRLELPVGKTFNDHVGVPLRYSINQTMFFYIGRDTQLSDIFQYITAQTGNFAKIMSTFGGIFTRSSIAKKRNSYPDLELTYGPQYRTVNPANPPGTDALQVISFLVGPKSVGNLKLKSNDPLDDLIINPNYLTAPEDMDRMIEALEINVNLMESSPEFQALGIQTAINTACANFPFKSKDYFRCVTRSAGGSGGQHYTGTCPMGVDSRTGVVDSLLRIFGVQGLRVMDASVMPLIPNAHTASATTMIAEVGASLILEENKPDSAFEPTLLSRFNRPRNPNSRRPHGTDVFYAANKNSYK